MSMDISRKIYLVQGVTKDVNGRITTNYLGFAFADYNDGLASLKRWVAQYEKYEDHSIVWESETKANIYWGEYQCVTISLEEIILCDKLG